MLLLDHHKTILKNPSPERRVHFNHAAFWTLTDGILPISVRLLIGHITSVFSSFTTIKIKCQWSRLKLSIQHLTCDVLNSPAHVIRCNFSLPLQWVLTNLEVLITLIYHRFGEGVSTESFSMRDTLGKKQLRLLIKWKEKWKANFLSSLKLLVIWIPHTSFSCPH